MPRRRRPIPIPGPPLIIGLLAATAVLVLVLAIPWALGRYGLAIAATAATIVLAFMIVRHVVSRPSNDRPWPAPFARLASAEIVGDQVTIHNVRNFRYRNARDFPPREERWETRNYQLSQLDAADLFMSYWGSRRVAHTILGFGFADGRRVCLSVEARRQVGEKYSAVRSLYKRYEIIYVIGDERDVIALRTNYRLEDAYLFPLQLTPAQIRVLFEDVLARVNELAVKPDFYQTIRGNCTTSLVRHFQLVANPPIRFSRNLLLNGLLPALVRDRGMLPADAPLEEVQQRYAISAKARAAGDGPDFSRAIREGLGAASAGEGHNH